MSLITISTSGKIVPSGIISIFIGFPSLSSVVFMSFVGGTFVLVSFFVVSFVIGVEVCKLASLLVSVQVCCIAMLAIEINNSSGK